MSQENQDALKCAELLEKRKILNIGQGEPCDESAAHIRRLVAENERLQKLCDERGSNEARMFLRCRELSDQVAALGAKGESATALVQQMLKAGKELNRFYSHIWDRVDGCAVIFPDSIPAFENAVEKHGEAITAAREWLGQKGETG